MSGVRVLLFLLSALLGLAGLSAPAWGGEGAAMVTGEVMVTGEAAVPPRGFVDFCRRHPQDCAARTSVPVSVVLNPARMAELDRVQRTVAARVRWADDGARHGVADFWDYPGPGGQGDCEDSALEKRRRLIALGWPRSALLLAGVQLPDGRYHVVLVVVGDGGSGDGEWVLDDRFDGVVPWTRPPYRWLLRQSRLDESAWVVVEPSGSPAAVAPDPRKPACWLP